MSNSFLCSGSKEEHNGRCNPATKATLAALCMIFTPAVIVGTAVILGIVLSGRLDKLSTEEISVLRIDRLEQTVLHLASMLNMTLEFPEIS